MKKSPRTPPRPDKADSKSRRDQDQVVAADWRIALIDRVRDLIRQAVPDVVEEIKWRKPSNGMRGVPVWSSNGILCTGETYKNAVKLTFAHGAALPDPAGLFNASLDGNARRAIDLPEGAQIDESSLKALIRAAAHFNASDGQPTPEKRRRRN